MRQETSTDGSHTLPGIVKRLALRLRLSFCEAAEAEEAAAAAAEASKQALTLASSKYSVTWICKRMIRLGNSHLYKGDFQTVRDVCWALVTRRNSRGGGEVEVTVRDSCFCCGFWAMLLSGHAGILRKILCGMPCSESEICLPSSLSRFQCCGLRHSHHSCFHTDLLV